MCDKDDAEAESGVLASSVGVEAGGDAPGDSVAAGFGATAMGASFLDGAFARE